MQETTLTINSSKITGSPEDFIFPVDLSHLPSTFWDSFTGTGNTHSLDLEASSSQYASITDAAQTGLDITGDLTIEAWVKRESASTQVIASKYESSTSNISYAFAAATSQLQLYISDTGSSTDTATISYTLTTGVWTHLSVTYLASTGATTFYANGVQVGTDTSTKTSIYNGSAEFTIGTLNTLSTPSNEWDGLIDEVRVWNDVRTADEIRGNMHKELEGTETNLQGYWKLNNNYEDSTANGNDLTASGSPVFSTDVSFDDSKGHIKVFKSDGVTELPRDLVSCDPTAQTGELHIKYTDLFFKESWNGSDLDTDYFSIERGTEGSNIVLDSGQLKMTGTGNGSTTPQLNVTSKVPTLKQGQYMEVKAIWRSTSQTTHSMGFYDGSGNSYFFRYEWNHSTGNNVLHTRAGDASTYQDISGTYYNSTHTYKIEYTTTGEVKFYIDGNIKRTVTGVTATEMNVGFGTYIYDNGTTHTFDYAKMGYINGDQLSSTVDRDIIIKTDSTYGDYDNSYIYGRNQVWADYEAVYHLDDGTDSTGNGYTLTFDNTTTVTGKFGSAQRLTKNASSIYNEAKDMQDYSVVTQQSWAKFRDTSFDTDDYLMTFTKDSNGGNISMTTDTPSSGDIKFKISEYRGSPFLANNASSADQTITVGQWYKFDLVYDGASTVLYEDASSIVTLSASGILVGQNCSIGSNGSPVGGSANWDVDEYRIRPEALSSDWITTEDQAQSDPSTFYTVESAVVDPASVTVTIPDFSIKIAPSRGTIGVSVSIPSYSVIGDGFVRNITFTPNVVSVDVSIPDYVSISSRWNDKYNPDAKVWSDKY